jgi:Rrf2 family protein
MKISRTIAYAVHATLELAYTEGNRPIPCRELADRGKMPDRFLLQILRTLVNHGILESTRGVDGGYRLSRAPDKITLLDIVDAFENSLDPTLPDLRGIPGNVRKKLLTTLELTASAAREELRKLTVDDLRHVGVIRPEV